jgi:hypothetical protein
MALMLDERTPTPNGTLLMETDLVRKVQKPQASQKYANQRLLIPEMGWKLH